MTLDLDICVEIQPSGHHTHFCQNIVLRSRNHAVNVDKGLVFLRNFLRKLVKLSADHRRIRRRTRLCEGFIDHDAFNVLRPLRRLIGPVRSFLRRSARLDHAVQFPAHEHDQLLQFGQFLRIFSGRGRVVLVINAEVVGGGSPDQRTLVNALKMHLCHACCRRSHAARKPLKHHGRIVRRHCCRNHHVRCAGRVGDMHRPYQRRQIHAVGISRDHHPHRRRAVVASDQSADDGPAALPGRHFVFIQPSFLLTPVSPPQSTRPAACGWCLCCCKTGA